MSEQEYMEQRVSDQINWYDRKSSSNKKYYVRLKVTEIILALSIPLLTGYIATESIVLKLLVGLIGVTVAAIANIITLYKFQENWIEYRTIAESLKHEKFLYVTKAGPYKDIASFPAFVERFESYVSKENSQWSTYVRSKEEAQKAQ